MALGSGDPDEANVRTTREEGQTTWVILSYART